jgi:radical SAM protein with 4Fe4S-binding SPASM domain
MDGFCEHSYSLRRGKIPFAQAKDFIYEAMKLREGREYPWISVRWVDNGQSEIEFQQFVEHWLFDIGVDFVLRSRFFEYGSEKNSPVSLALPQKCRSLVEGNPVVLFNGDVLLCERTPDRSKYVLGNVLKDDWETIMSRRQAMTENYPDNEPCKLCSAAYVLTGMKGIMQFRHGNTERKVYVHSDHSQTFLSLDPHWAGINWSLE